MSHRSLRLGLTTLTVTGLIGLAATVAPVASAADAPAATNTCHQGEFCLFSGPRQTGQIIYRLDAKVTRTGFTFPEVDSLDPVITPLSAHNPIPDSFGCIVRLNDKPHFAGSEQEIDGVGDHELTGGPVGSITPDCG
ncbi:peptidase inhibitor family I36 protein [Streptomyces sp. L2]|uniref:peptidase inhibitor family I36 protein n=1 Tax=Streptomyces sp. L2 TaxID=2162665 RepID=UPI001011CF85|nr:peptidase inhibitor family I36 protein [Streptomyces sp. L2]